MGKLVSIGVGTGVAFVIGPFFAIVAALAVYIVWSTAAILLEEEE